MTLKCTGQNCPLGFGAVLRCTFNCEHRTPPMTNADKIRAMTDEELAELMVYQTRCPDECIRESSENCYARRRHGSCEGCWLNWLKSEAEED